MKYDVFISYRREGGDTLAQLLYDRLTHSGYRVFLDIESLNAGKFNEKLLDVIDECKDIIVVLPPNALDRCHNEGDWLYREIEYGIKHSKNIVPVMMKDFVWPDNIPETIADLQYYNGILDNKDYFDAVIDKIATLLKSKPLFGGGFRIKFEDRKLTVKEQAKRKKRIITVALAGIVCCAGVFCFLQHQKEQQKLRAESYVSIELTPNEEMTASEYYDAIDILEKRFELLADGQDYSFEAEEDLITISIPIDVFHDTPALDLLKSSVTRPNEMYLAPDTLYEEDYFFHIERSSVENLEIVSDIPVELDLTSLELYGAENIEDCQYYALTLDQKTADSIKAWMAEVGAYSCRLYTDFEEFGYFSSFYYLMEMDENDDTIYFFGNCQYENFFNLTEYNFTHETFSHAFSVNMTIPVKWEDTKNAQYSFGKNQCNEDRLTGPLVRLDYTTYRDEFTEGERQDTIAIMKSRLDLLGTPYAFGYRADNPNIMSVKLDPSYLNDQIVNLIGTKSSFGISSNFYEIMYNCQAETDKIEILQNDDGSYSLTITPNDTWFNQLSKADWPDELDTNETIYLCHDGIAISPTTLAEAYDGKTFTFDNLSYFGLDSVDEKHKYIFELIQKVNTDPALPYEYRFANSYYENVEDARDIIYLSEAISDETKQKYETVLSDISCVTEYEVNVSDIGQTIIIHLTLPIDESYAANVNQILQTLYEECEIKNGNIDRLWIYFKENMDDLRDNAWADNGYYVYYILSPHKTTHKMHLTLYNSAFISNEDITKIETILNTDEFYEQFTIDDMNLDENGNITLI